jgi:hypothetical protein
MNRSVCLRLGLALCVILGTSAQAPESQPAPQPAPTAPMDPHVYQDDAMNFTAPAEYRLVAIRHVAPSDLDGPTTVAEWVKNPGQTNQSTLQVTLEPNDGVSLDGYATGYSNELREQIDGVLINSQQRLSTPNGMPIYFLTITSGDGFNAVRRYTVIWPDGLRGVSISLTARLGQIGADEAKTVLKNIYAVLYPLRRS